jgi:signal transduction histidine kinase
LRLKLALWRDWVQVDPDQMQSELDHAEKTLDATIQELRRSIYALRPLALGEMDFLPALQRYIADFNEQQQETYVTLHVDLADEPLPADLELPLFRVIQEGLNNITQHARASLAWVELAVSGDRGVTLTVRDNGRGFDVAAVAGNGRLGLLQMRERVETAGGHLTVASQPGQGTKIQVRLPWT